MYDNYAAFRNQRGMTDAQVAAQTGIAPQTLSAWKQGLYRPKYEKLKMLADFFDVTVEDLIGD